MTFIVFRTSSPMYEREGFEKYPCDGAHIVDHRPTFVDDSGSILYDNTYELDIDLPGFKKDEVQLDLKDGYLTISAAKGLDKDQEDKKGKYIRQERYAGACSRSFFVGEGIEPRDVSAKFEDGILRVSLPKQVKKELPRNSTITIE